MGAALWRLPARGITLDLLRHGAVVWLWCRLALVTFAAITSWHTPTVVALRSPTSALFVIGVGTLAWLEVRRRHQDRFLANLGVSPWIVAAIGTTPALVAELAISFAVNR